MASPACLPLVDVIARIELPSKQLANSIAKFFRTPKPNWRYLPTIAATPYIAEHAPSPEAAERQAMTGSVSGHKANASAARALFALYGRRRISARKIASCLLPIRTDRPNFGPVVRPAAVFSYQSGPHIIEVQPRKSLHLSARQWAIYEWFVRRAYITTGYAGWNVEFADLSSPDGGARMPRIIVAPVLSDITDAYMLDRIQAFVVSFDQAVAMVPPETFAARRHGAAETRATPLFSP